MKAIYTIGLGVLVSLFFYPIAFSFLPSLNTKMMLAVLGLAFFALEAVRRVNRISKSTIASTLIAVVFSLYCYFVAVHFNTGDDSYSTYYMSFFVWLFGGYAICFLIRRNHGMASLKLITHYLGAAGVFQCIMSQLIADFPKLRMMIDGAVVQGQEFIQEVNRLYGIGASLDSGGVRFAITLLLLAYFIVECGREKERTKELWVLIIEFIVITIFGNMIARTTTVGALLGLAYIGIKFLANNGVNIKISVLKSICSGLLLLFAAVLLSTYLYATNTEFNQNLRFAFEGFFNWVETGTFQSDSLDKMNNTMWIWPKDLRTWLIGTGVFGNWAYSTDIGYCRFILYCGIIGFSMFASLFIYNAYIFSRKFDNVKLLAFFMMALSFIIWLKVSTDIFQIYALLICADATRAEA